MSGEEQNPELLDLPDLPAGEEGFSLPSGLPDGLPETLPETAPESTPEGALGSAPHAPEPGAFAEIGAGADFSEPPGDPDPALDLDQVLSAAILEMPAESEPFSSEGNASPASFQLRLSGLGEDAKAALRDKAKVLGIEVASAWSAPAPILSQLTEFQAVELRRAALSLGWQVQVQARLPCLSADEEEAALGGLSEVPEPVLPFSEGAPSVALPGREQTVMLFSGGELAGYQLQQTQGVVAAHRSLARRFFREEELQERTERELGRLAQKTLPSSRLELLLRELFLDLQKSALSRGCNAVFGLRLEAFPETTHLDPALEQLRLVAFGTAAVVEKS